MELTAEQAHNHVPSGFTPPPTEPLKHQLLAALAQHRMATTHQLHVLLRPGRTRQTISQQLNDLLGKHLVGFVVLPQSHRSRVWYLTPKGARLTRDWPALRGRPPYPITSATAASLKTPHTLTVLRTHLAFVADARHRGDEHGHLDWTPEVFPRSATARKSSRTRSCTTRSSRANSGANCGHSWKSTAPP